MNINLDKIAQLAPEFKKDVASLLELNAKSSYILELDAKIPASQYQFIAENISSAFKSLGLNCIIIPNGIIANIYKLKGGETDDSRTSVE